MQIITTSIYNKPVQMKKHQFVFILKILEAIKFSIKHYVIGLRTNNTTNKSLSKSYIQHAKDIYKEGL